MSTATLPLTFSPGDLVTAHLPDGRTVEGRYWSHPRCEYTCVIDWHRSSRADNGFRKIVAGTVVHAMSVRPCHHGADAMVTAGR